jgi:hypothetical protein
LGASGGGWPGGALLPLCRHCGTRAGAAASARSRSARSTDWRSIAGRQSAFGECAVFCTHVIVRTHRHRK